ncbi:InlB B-repeat-containing protein [Marasmitruncus massiliensis]|uniref:InlB B-repeat-containing protein n=1 Tax=Marasmitruncus massiliensis TaxID=1944642 RepID=UPI000C7C0424|nr:hypothetical protein [Marasmitruncus massiliensis]
MRRIISMVLAAVMAAGYLSVGVLAFSPRGHSRFSGTSRRQALTSSSLPTDTEGTGAASSEVSSSEPSSSEASSSSAESSSSEASSTQARSFLSLLTAQLNESLEPCTVTYSVGAGGTLYLNDMAYTASGSIEVENGASLSVSATADTGYSLGSLLINSEPYSIPTTYKITSGTSISAAFLPVDIDSSSSAPSSSEDDSSPSTPSSPEDNTSSSTSASWEDETVVYPITYNNPDNGVLSVTSGDSLVPSGNALETGSSVAITATPADGYELESLTVNGAAINNGDSYTIDSTTTVFASFAEEETSYTITFTESSAFGNLTVTHNGLPVSSGTSLPENAAVTITATPVDGYELASLTVNGTAINNGDSYTINSATTVSASFTKKEVSYTVTFTESSAYGNLAVTHNGSSVSSGTSLPENAAITITATPADGYAFSFMRINGTNYTNSSVSYTLTGDTAISATFSTSLPPTNTETTASSYNVTVPTVSNGTLSVRGYVGGIYKTLTAGTTVVDADSTLTVTADANSGYRLTYLAIGGSTWSPNTSSAYTQSATVTADTAITATFTAISYTGSTGYVTQPIAVYDEDGETLEDNSGDNCEIDDIASNGRLTLDGLLPNQTFYIKLGETGNDLATILSDGDTATASQLADDDLFKLSIDKDGSGKSLISSITQVGEKRLDGDSVRGSYLKVVLKDSTTTDELKATAEITFKARKTLSTSDGDEGTWDSGEYAVLDLVMWINNSEISGSDGEADTGDSVYFSPESDEVNTFIWGDDRAAIEFTADDDAEDFYARLSTKSDVDIYTEYGDPVDADLWFYNFVGNPTVPSTSRAALTLGIPWDEDDDDYPDPEDCYIYELDSDGYLSDVTERFTYSEDSYAIDGWTVKTRVLGTYIVSDTELDVYSQDYEVEYVEEDDDTAADDLADDYESMVKVNPSTGNGGYSYTPVTVPAATESTQAEETSNIKITNDNPDLKSVGLSDADPDSGNAERTAQEDTFPWAGALIATVLVLASSITGGYFLYRRMHQ